MTSNPVNMSIKVMALRCWKNEYIILCYFGARIMSSFEVIEGWEGRRGKRRGDGALDLPQVDLTRVSKQAERAF